MAPRSKLKIALAKEKGLNDLKLKQIKDKKKHKAVVKEKRKKGLLPEKKEAPKEEEWEDDEDEEDEVSEDDDAENGLFDMEAEESEGDESEDEELGGTTSAAALMNESDSDSESEVDMEEKIQRIFKPKSTINKNEVKSKLSKSNAEQNDDDNEDDDDEEESDIALSDLDDMADSDREDLYVQTRLTINNQPALLAALKRIAITRTDTFFSTHHVVVSRDPTAPQIEDISDDLQREQALFAQCLNAATRARVLLRKEGAPFSRPKDYFAEMVKDDGHMEKVKAKLIEEATSKKAASEARKQRDLKKFGKQVQHQKLQERSKAKRETLEKIKELKKKRSEHGNNDLTKEADLFDVGVDTELNKNGKRGRGGEQNGRGANTKRQKKDTKYGFGGRKRGAKAGDAASSGDLSGFNARKMKSQGGGAGPGGKKKFVKTARLGKSKRQGPGGGGGKR